MRIGFDVDGCLANFNVGYIQQHIAVTGRDMFLPGDEVNLPVWDFAAYRGYTKEETSVVWERIKESSTFWEGLPVYGENCDALSDWFMRYYNHPLNHDIYFITSRPGDSAKGQTERWFEYAMGIPSPTVLVVGSHQKGNIAKALNLDCYIDDYYENCVDVVRVSPHTRCYILDRHYNRRGTVGLDTPNVSYTNTTVEERRVLLLEQMLRREKLIT